MSVVYLLIALSISSVVSQEWVVSIDSGSVRGFWSQEYNVWAFRGIPYATPPLGDLRFKSPLPPAPWNGIFNASTANTYCMQAPITGAVITEDCLIINVFVPPSGSTAGNLPILFFIHGGGFSFGNSNTYNPRWTTRHDVILVTFNYRMGPFGYLCLGTDRIPGNAGLKDAIAALRWTKMNINKFGGNPDAITIYGESSSGVQTEALVLSKETEGLFQRAIVESGSSLNAFGVNYNRLGIAKAIAHTLGFPYLDDLNALATFLENTSAEELRLGSTSIGASYNLCIEKEINGVESAVTEVFRNTYKSGSYVKVPMLYAFAELDGVFVSLDFNNRLNELENQFENFLPIDLVFPNELERKNAAQEVKEAYFGAAPINASDDNFRKYADYRTDQFFVAGMILSSLQHVKNSVPLYMMELSYRGGFNQPTPRPDLNVAGHADIVAHVLDLGHYNNDTLAEDQIVRDRMTELFTNFVKYGNPTPSSSSLGVQWLPFTEQQQHYLNVGRNLTLRQFPRQNRSAVWEKLYESYYYPPPLFDNTHSVATRDMPSSLCLSMAVLISFTLWSIK